MSDGQPDIWIGLLDEVCVKVDGVALPLPPSRKTRALLALLVIESRPQRREALCEMLWSTNDDPRAGLRWSLTKLRGLVGDLLVADRRAVSLRLDHAKTDFHQLHAALEATVDPDLRQLREFESALRNGYLNNLDCTESPGFELWLDSQRFSLRRLHDALLQKLCVAAAAEPSRAIDYARKRVAINPINIDANLALLELLLTYEGMSGARTCFEQCRQRLRRSRVDESLLLQGWRELAGISPARLAFEPLTQEREHAHHEAAAEPQLPQKPSLAVLGFRDVVAGDSAITTGLTADLITRLSRLGSLFVIARASSTRFDSLAYTFPQIGRMLGVRYLVQGTTQQHNARLRINVELVDAQHSCIIWAESFERSLGDVFLMQDEVANAIVSAVGPEIERAEYERARPKPPENLDAWENYHMALWHSFRFTGRDTEIAAVYLGKALLQDPLFSRAHAAQSLTHYTRAFLDSCDDVDKEIQLALDSAQQSVSLDCRDAMAHWSLGRAQFLARQHDMAMLSLDRALQVNPNYAQGYYAKGFVGSHSGLLDTAMPCLESAERLSPFDPLLFAMKSSRAVNLVARGDYEDAVEWAVRATLEPNAHFHIYAIAAACLQLVGQHADAQQYIEATLRRHPGYSQKIFFRSFPYRDAVHQKVVADALANAGLS